MATELSPEQSQAVSLRPDGPVEVVDPATRREYVLLRRGNIRAPRDSRPCRRAGHGTPPVAAAPEDWEDAANYDEPTP